MDKKSSSKISRRDFLRLSGLAAAGGILASCSPKAPATLEPTAPGATTGFTQDAALKATSYADWINLGARTQDKVSLKAVTYLIPDSAADGTHYDDRTYLDYVQNEWKKLYPNGEFTHESVSWNEIDAKEVAYANRVRTWISVGTGMVVFPT
jgi:hypothetical protein